MIACFDSVLTTKLGLNGGRSMKLQDTKHETEALYRHFGDIEKTGHGRSRGFPGGLTVSIWLGKRRLVV